MRIWEVDQVVSGETKVQDVVWQRPIGKQIVCHFGSQGTGRPPANSIHSDFSAAKVVHYDSG